MGNTNCGTLVEHCSSLQPGQYTLGFARSGASSWRGRSVVQIDNAHRFEGVLVQENGNRPAMNESTGRVVEAERFVLRDSKAKVRAVLGTNGDGPTLELFDQNGRARLSFEVREDRARVQLLGGKGDTRGLIWADDTAVEVKLFSKHGNGSLALQVATLDEGGGLGPRLYLSDKSDSGVDLMLGNTDGLPHLVFYDRDHRPRMHLAVDALGQPHIFRHRLCPPLFNLGSGHYESYLPYDLWGTKTYVAKKLTKLRAQLSGALAELGGTSDKIAATLTRLGIMPLTDDAPLASLIARYLHQHWRLRFAFRQLTGVYCTVSSERVTCWGRVWFFLPVQVTVDPPPAVREFLRNSP
jgi:hypothetical protein